MRIQIRTTGSLVIRGLALNRAIADALEQPPGTYAYEFFGWPSLSERTNAIIITVML